MQYVFNFVGESLDCVFAAIQSTLGGAQYKLRELSTDGDIFVPSDAGLIQAVQEMKLSKLATIAIHPRTGPIRYALILSPLTAGRSLSLYQGSIEYTGDDFLPTWHMLLRASGLSLISIGFEEGVEISDDVLSPTAFRWNEWPLVMAAIKSSPSDTKWTIRAGPEITSVPVSYRPTLSAD